MARCADSVHRGRRWRGGHERLAELVLGLVVHPHAVDGVVDQVGLEQDADHPDLALLGPDGQTDVGVTLHLNGRHGLGRAVGSGRNDGHHGETPRCGEPVARVGGTINNDKPYPIPFLSTCQSKKRLSKQPPWVGRVAPGLMDALRLGGQELRGTQIRRRAVFIAHHQDDIEVIVRCHRHDAETPAGDLVALAGGQHRDGGDGGGHGNSSWVRAVARV